MSEDPAVFRACHAKLFELVERGLVHGVGSTWTSLYDPEAYLATSARSSAAAPAREVPSSSRRSSAGEVLPASWDAAGTTGYSSPRARRGCSSSGGRHALSRRSTLRDVGDKRSFDAHVLTRSAPSCRRALASEVGCGAPARGLAGPSAARGPHREACSRRPSRRRSAFPVYRTYVRGRPPDAGGRAIVRRAIRRARRATELRPRRAFSRGPARRGPGRPRGRRARGPP